MINRKYRLPVKNFRGQGEDKLTSPYFLIKTANNSLSYNRIAVIISNKVDKRSARRHFLKRRMLAMLSGLPQTSKDILMIVSPAANHLGRIQLKKEMENLIRRIK